MISTVPSVEPPSIMMYSRLGYPCSSTLLIVASMYRPWLNEGVTTDIFGQSPLLPFILRPSPHLRSHSTSEYLGGSSLAVENSEVDRKSTRLNSSHANISYDVFCLTKKH